MTNAPAPIANDPQVNQVIEHILDGLPLRQAVKMCGLTPQLFNYRLQSDKAAAVAYARATEIRADLLADEALHIADTEADASKARNQIQVRQWLASKLHAKRYGDRIDLNVTQTIDIGSTLAEARARLLRPVSVQQDITDLQVIDLHRENHIEPSDNESLTPAPDAVPDIFT